MRANANECMSKRAPHGFSSATFNVDCASGENELILFTRVYCTYLWITNDWLLSISSNERDGCVLVARDD